MADTSETNRAWLEQKLGPGRIEGPHKDGADHELVLTRANGKRVYIYGKSPQETLAQARKYVEEQTRGSR